MNRTCRNCIWRARGAAYDWDICTLLSGGEIDIGNRLKNRLAYAEYENDVSYNAEFRTHLDFSCSHFRSEPFREGE